MSEQVYLLRKPECRDLNRVKIGRSGKNDLNRVMSYGKQTEILAMMSVKNSTLVEQKLKVEFKKNFDCTKNGGENFEGNIDEMKKMFMKIVMRIEYPDVVKDILCSSFESSQLGYITPQETNDATNMREEEQREEEEEKRRTNEIKQMEQKLTDQKKEQKKLLHAKLQQKTALKQIQISAMKNMTETTEADQKKILNCIEIQPGARTSRYEIDTYFQTMPTLNHVSSKVLFKILKDIPGIIYDRTGAKRVGGESRRGVFRELKLKDIS